MSPHRPHFMNVLRCLGKRPGFLSIRWYKTRDEGENCEEEERVVRKKRRRLPTPEVLFGGRSEFNQGKLMTGKRAPIHIKCGGTSLKGNHCYSFLMIQVSGASAQKKGTRRTRLSVRTKGEDKAGHFLKSRPYDNLCAHMVRTCTWTVERIYVGKVYNNGCYKITSRCHFCGESILQLQLLGLNRRKRKVDVSLLEWSLGILVEMEENWLALS
ncbi:unnamed protein product [Allacma fusca]|uniref:Uncharacterized protein n=1 Tax=Allacma fusca TaxID=39272 RepID=A0A8J2J189_9HEXA|nr:unnamed protein product [Allacma fusca]